MMDVRNKTEWMDDVVEWCEANLRELSHALSQGRIYH